MSSVVLPQDVFARVRNEEQRLWIPGQGEISLGINRLQEVLREEDERLELAKHEITGDWVVFIKLGVDNLYPVIGIGRELCSPEELRERLHRADAKRHGDKILQSVNQHNERIKQVSRDRALEADEAMAEGFEWGFRREGVLSRKVFIPRNL